MVQLIRAIISVALRFFRCFYSVRAVHSRSHFLFLLQAMELIVMLFTSPQHRKKPTYEKRPSQSESKKRGFLRWIRMMAEKEPSH